MKKYSVIGITVLGILIIVAALFFITRPKDDGRYGLDIYTGTDHPIRYNTTALREMLEELPPDSSRARAIREVLNAELEKEEALAQDGDEDIPTPEERALKRWESVIDVFRTELPSTAASSDDDEEETRYPEVTEADQRRVRDLFNALTEEQQLEETHHAMNLLPDETVSLMYEILFDKTQNEDVIDIIFSDILNRDESLKDPVMEEIIKDPEHPMFAEASRILEITRDDPEDDSEDGSDED